MVIMACVWASAQLRTVFAAKRKRVVSAAAASETTGQCETSRARLATQENAFTSHDRPFALRVLSHTKPLPQSATS